MKTIQIFKRLCLPQLFKINECCQNKSVKALIRYNSTLSGSNIKYYIPKYYKMRTLGLGPTSKDFEEPSSQSGPLTKLHATELILRLTEEERKALFSALEEYQSQKIKEEFEGKTHII